MSFLTTSTTINDENNDPKPTIYRVRYEEASENIQDMLDWFNKSFRRYFPASLNWMIGGSTVLTKYILYTEGRQPFPVNDVDVYFENRSDWTDSIKYMNDTFHFKRNYETAQTVNTTVDKRIDLDLCKSSFGNGTALIQSYDLGLICAAVEKRGGEMFWTYSEQFIEDVKERLIRINSYFDSKSRFHKGNSHSKANYMFSMMKRFLKYKARGFTEHDAHLLRFMDDIGEEENIDWSSAKPDRANHSLILKK